MILRWSPSVGDLEALIAGLQERDLTDPDVGVTLTGGPLPPGTHHQHHQAELGRGSYAFARASEGLRRWQPQRGSGFLVVPAEPPLEPGTDVVVVMGLGPVRLVVPCRVVAVVDEPGRFGFAYGTLPGHPEVGEESFVVTRDGDGVVRFEVTAFSRPGDLLTRLGGPVLQRVQHAAGRRYLKAMQTFVRP